MQWPQYCTDDDTKQKTPAIYPPTDIQLKLIGKKPVRRATPANNQQPSPHHRPPAINKKNRAAFLKMQ